MGKVSKVKASARWPAFVAPAEGRAEAQDRFEMLTARLPKDNDIEGVEYLKNATGCKAILSDRRGSDGLPLCCGRPRFVNGSESVYCRLHHRRFHCT